jgi:hypothetical protein
MAGRPSSLRARLAAVGIDYLVVLGYLIGLIAIGIAISNVPGLAAPFDDPIVGEFIGFVVLTLPVMLYFAISEASAAGATHGRRRRPAAGERAARERMAAGGGQRDRRDHRPPAPSVADQVAGTMVVGAG